LSDILDELAGLGVADHKRDDPLPEIVIEQSEDGSLRHAFAPEQCGLHFTGADAVPAGLAIRCSYLQAMSALVLLLGSRTAW
jgi:hypothetical protein